VQSPFTTKKPRTEVSQLNHGFTLLEALVTIGLAAIILSIYTAMLTGAHYLTRQKYSIQAAGFVQEGLDVLRTIEFSELLNRTEGGLLGMAFTRGDWEITGGADKVLELTSDAADWIGETGLALLPGSYREDFVYSAKVNIDGSSPSGWGGGIAFRYRDAENHYRFRYMAGGIALDLVHQGTVSTLWSQSGTYIRDAWYELEVTASGPDFTLKRNGITLANVNDETLTIGDLALLASGDALVKFNDVTVTGDEPGSWNFDGETSGEYPVDWHRLSPFDLPGGTASLTISDYLGLPDMKQASLYITWVESGGVKNINGTSIIANDYGQ
jgi:prepilin-type N-terminal cleavage/methylation domain-containing protein